MAAMQSSRDMELHSLSERKHAFTEEEEQKPELVGTISDESDMRRLGKKQEFQRNFQFISITAFSVITISGWCFVPGTAGLALANGGTGGFIAMYLVNYVGLLFVIVSLAEMSSMAPTAGGQYHWASEFAPRSIQKFVSYLAGWMSLLSWLAGVAGGMFLAGEAMQGLIIITKPNYVPQPYQGYLFVVMIASVGFVVNSVLARHLPKLEGLVFIMFMLFFIVILVVLWVLSPKLSASEVFQTFEKGGGWPTLGISMLAGQSNLMFVILGSDATAHMAEETKHASTVIPKAMIASYVINGALAFVMIVTYCFTLVDYQSAVNSPVGLFELPFIQVFANATGSIGGGAALVSLLVILQVFGTFNFVASTSRQMFAFARDRALPFSSWIAKVDAGGTFPINAVIVVWFFVVLLCLIALGSVVAFDAIVSLPSLAFMFTYLVSVSCLTWRRYFGPALPPSPWTLGRFGGPINIIAIMYCIYIIVFLPFPTAIPVTAVYFNWAPVIFGGVMILAVLYYIAYARKTYEGPVAYVRHREE